MPTKPLAQPQRTQSAEEFLASEENRTGLARTSTLTWQAMCEFAEAYAQSLQQAAAPTGKCGLPHSLPTVYHPCCLAKGHNPEDMHLFMPIQVSETYYCTPARSPRSRSYAVPILPALELPPQPVADPSKEELVIEIARELYDRFVMGVWEPQDAYPQIRKWLRSRGEAMKDNVQGCPRCGHNWKFGEINKETCGFHQCGCRHEWHAIPRMSAVPERGAPPEKEK